MNHSVRVTTAIVRGVGGAREGAASVTAETAPHGPPSHSAIMAAQESNAIPTGPRITQGVRRTKVSHRRRPRFTAIIVTRAAVGPFTQVQSEQQTTHDRAAVDCCAPRDSARESLTHSLL